MRHACASKTVQSANQMHILYSVPGINLFAAVYVGNLLVDKIPSRIVIYLRIPEMNAEVVP